MRVRELHEEFPWTEGVPRGDYIHLSDTINVMAEQIRDSFGEIYDATRMQFEKGYLWEVALSTAFGAKASHPKTGLNLDEVFISPDGLSYDRKGNMVVEEYKCTSKSPDTNPTSMWRWMMQAKGYCKVLGTTKAIFRILHMTFVPTYKVWELTFTQAEIDENWAAVVAARDCIRRGTDHGKIT